MKIGRELWRIFNEVQELEFYLIEFGLANAKSDPLGQRDKAYDVLTEYLPATEIQGWNHEFGPPQHEQENDFAGIVPKCNGATYMLHIWTVSSKVPRCQRNRKGHFKDKVSENKEPQIMMELCGERLTLVIRKYHRQNPNVVTGLMRKKLYDIRVCRDFPEVVDSKILIDNKCEIKYHPSPSGQGDVGGRMLEQKDKTQAKTEYVPLMSLLFICGLKNKILEAQKPKFQ
ncbi:hypothetical protein Tco_0769445 [Tanacetum coccineum]|uniref:Uncharacterized protein n=1 Tax=Tanacetum coccineum TaxID=301880 RepID=A0ABQ4Z9E3_9ASTR